MSRLSRSQMQEHNRAKVLAAAREEFTERGFREARIDDIAERAGLTRGAVYSNFPSKRALYFAVLAGLAEGGAGTGSPAPPPDGADRTGRAALGRFARAWLAGLPLATDEPRSPGRLSLDLMPEIQSDDRVRQAFAQLMKLNALLLGLALEQLRGSSSPGRQVPLAEAVLTTLHGARQLAATAPGFAAEFSVVSICEQLPGLELEDGWPPAHLPWAPPPRPVSQPWAPPAAADVVRGHGARLNADGVVAILGLHRLEAAEEAVRAAAPADEVTAVLVTGDPGELCPLARLSVASLCRDLRLAFPAAAWPRLQVVHDEAGAVAAAAGVAAVSDATETAIRVSQGRIVARAEGPGACHAVAPVPPPDAGR